MAAFRDETGIDMSYLTVLYEGANHGDPATAEIVQEWNDAGVYDAYPVLADPSGADLGAALPFFTGAVPIQCALTPELRFLTCWVGHEGDEQAYAAIEADAAAR